MSIDDVVKGEWQKLGLLFQNNHPLGKMAQMMAKNGATNGATNQTAKANEIGKQFAEESWNKIQPKAVFSTRFEKLLHQQSYVLKNQHKATKAQLLVEQHCEPLYQ